MDVYIYTCIHQVEEGNIEYKLKLLNPSSSRFEHLVTQMKWRLQEGRGEAIYEIGVADCGALTGLNEEELKMSLDTLSQMAKRYGKLQLLKCGTASFIVVQCFVHNGE